MPRSRALSSIDIALPIGSPSSRQHHPPQSSGAVCSTSKSLGSSILNLRHGPQHSEGGRLVRKAFIEMTTI